MPTPIEQPRIYGPDGRPIQGATLRAKDGSIVRLPYFQPSPEELEAAEAIRRSQYFLVRQGADGIGEVFTCKTCGGKHRYFTLNCREQPYSGVTMGLWAFFKTVGKHGAEATMNDAQLERMRRLQSYLGPLGDLPELAHSHPLLAQRLSSAERNLDIHGTALGILEPIDQRMAQRMLDRVNVLARPPLRVPGLR